MEAKKPEPRRLTEEELDFLRARMNGCFLCKWIVDAYADQVQGAGGSDGSGGKHLLSEAAAVLHVEVELLSMQKS